MKQRVFIWVAHPRNGSLCSALADAYQKGLERGDVEVRRMDLSDMRFSACFDGYKDAAPLEPDLLRWQEAVRWADHLLVVHPYWWGAMPTMAKAVLDRGLTPGFAYKYHRRGVKWDKLLTGRTADVLITSDTPPWLDTLLYWRPARRVLKNQVLGFCGIATRKMFQFGSVKTANAARIDSWIARAERLGASAATA